MNTYVHVRTIYFDNAYRLIGSPIQAVGVFYRTLQIQYLYRDRQRDIKDQQNVEILTVDTKIILEMQAAIKQSLTITNLSFYFLSIQIFDLCCLKYFRSRGWLLRLLFLSIYLSIRISFSISVSFPLVLFLSLSPVLSSPIFC